MDPSQVTVDGNEAAARIAYLTNEVIAIYPITPASPMGEWADSWSAAAGRNLWGSVPQVIEMQSEAGAAGAIHGALQAGALASSFTASQGLLLMIPNMYKIAGELSPTVLHVAARSLAVQALSIFGDHSDVMACRTTGYAMLCSASVQEVQDFALIAQLASLSGRIPFVHFFDGFRTSHEVDKIAALSPEEIERLIDHDAIRAHRSRAMSPDHPVLRGTSQNPDVYFQGRESVNPFYERLPGIIEDTMRRFAQLTGRRYDLFEYHGVPNAERVLVLMGSGLGAAQEAVDTLATRGEKVGLLKVRLYRPLSTDHLLAALPDSAKSLAVLDRTKEPGADGEPLYKDVVTTLAQAVATGRRATMPRVIGGRYGLSSKEFTPGMAAAVLTELSENRPHHPFTIGIHDDVCGTSLDWDERFTPDAAAGVTRCVFYGLGSDGTVSANKNSIKIIGDNTDQQVQGYFQYDSKKAGAATVSHLRFGGQAIRSTYLIGRNEAQFVACHQPNFLGRYDMLDKAAPGGVFLLNSPAGPDAVWDSLPRAVQQAIIDKDLSFFTIDAYRLARSAGMGRRINTIMQVCFFAITRVLDIDHAIALIKQMVETSYGRKGRHLLQRNNEAIDSALEGLHRVALPNAASSHVESPLAVAANAPEFVRQVTARLIAGRGDELPVSAMSADGTWPLGTAAFEKRRLALEIPRWEADLCTHCGKCPLVCLCVEICPIADKHNPARKALNMVPVGEHLVRERENWTFFLSLPEFDRTLLRPSTLKGAMMMQPLFEFSGACVGCGETPYIKLATQLFGDRMLIANATGCSSIYGGNLPTTPYTTNPEGRGPAWNNSLFEDNAEFGLGMRVAIDEHAQRAAMLLRTLASEIGESLVDEVLSASQQTEAQIFDQRERLDQIRQRLGGIDGPQAHALDGALDYLAKKSVWLIGGDGWAYDIGYGGVDHVLASGRDVNILVLDTEVYSNTGGQTSKATPLGAVAKFSAAGKPVVKKDLAMMAMAYGNVYVAQVAYGAKDVQVLHAFLEAESYEGPSLIIAYSPCIAHGIDLTKNLHQQHLAVDAGHWGLFRFDPRKAASGENPLHLDSREPSIPYEDFAMSETRFSILERTHPAAARQFLTKAQHQTRSRFRLYEQLAKLAVGESDER